MGGGSRYAAAVGLSALLAAAPASALPPVKPFVAGGVALPVAAQSFADGWDPGLHLAAGFALRTSSRFLPWIEVGWSRLAFDTEAFEADVQATYPGLQVSGNALLVFSLAAGAEVALTSWGNTRPYIAAGLGYDHLDRSQPTASGPGSGNVEFPDPTDDALSLRAAFGVRTLVTPTVTLFLDAGWHHAWSSPDGLDLVPLRLGLRF